jgi:hypothetical protein
LIRKTDRTSIIVENKNRNLNRFPIFFAITKDNNGKEITTMRPREINNKILP